MASTNYILKSSHGQIKAPAEFINSCTTFTSMFEDIGSVDNDEPILITDNFTFKEVNQYIKLFMNLDTLKVSNDSGVEMSYLKYIIDFREEFIKNYTNKNIDPPHCECLYEIYNDLGEENIVKMLELDGFFNNLKLRRGIMLLIAAFIRKGDEDKVNEIIGSIIEVVQGDSTN